MPLIEVVDADPGWADDFDRIEADLRSVLGDRAAAIDHIGSTSVPGLAAKDIIDVQITVDALAEADAAAALVAAGYTARPHITSDLLTGCDDRDELRKEYVGERPGERRANIHIRERGRRNQRYALLFRDHLRADPVVRAAYAEIKRVLAAEHPEDAEGYYAVKDPVMDLIHRSSEHWAVTVGWEPS